MCHFYDLECLESQLNMDQLVGVDPSVTTMVEVGGSGLGSASLQTLVSGQQDYWSVCVHINVHLCKLSACFLRRQYSVLACCVCLPQSDEKQHNPP